LKGTKEKKASLAPKKPAPMKSMKKSAEMKMEVEKANFSGDSD